MERGNYANWNYPKAEWKETETGRSDRRSRNSKERLIEAVEIRVEGIKKHDAREEKERKRREKEIDMRHPEQTTGR